MISYEQALTLIRAHAKRQPVINIPVTEALHRVCAADLQAAISIPPFDNSAMDGFALRSRDTQAASEDQPLTLTVDHWQAAGDNPAKDNQVVEIMTGAVVPQGLDTVIPIEDVTCIPGANGFTASIQLTQPVPINKNIRRAGEDFQAGDPLVNSGTRLNAGHLAALITTGIHTIPVYDLPQVAVLTTGKEVTDDYATTLDQSQIYNSNTPYLVNHLNAGSIPTKNVGHIGDSPDLFADILTHETDARILISTGAVSKGQWDFIPDVLRQQNAEIIFHRVAIKPGKPILFAQLSDGRYFFGLPGNPVSAAVGLRFFVQPLIRAILGMADEPMQYATIDEEFKKHGHLRHFLKAFVASDQNGQRHLELLQGQESFKVSPFLAMNCWAILAEEAFSFHRQAAIQIASTALFPEYV